MVRGLRLGDFKKTNIWVTVLVVGAVLLLLFFPDMFGLDSVLTTTPTKFSLELPRVAVSGDRKLGSVPQNIVVEEVDRTEIKSDLDRTLAGRSSLDQLLYLVREGYIDHLVDKRERIESERSATPGRAMQDSHSVDGQVPFIPRDRATWDQLRSKTVQRSVRSLQGKITVLSRDLEDFPQSKFAITNLFSGLDSVLNDLDRQMSAAEAIQYIEELDLAVTRTLLKEGVPRSEVIRWSEISLASVLGTRRGDRLKKSSVPKFNPRLTLQQVQIFKPANSSGKLVPETPPRISFEAALVGEEISKVELFKNGVWVRGISPRPDRQVRGLLRIESYMHDAQGVYEVRISDKYGNVYSKYYDFMKRAAQFGWRYQEERNLYWAVLAPKIERTPGGLDWYFGFQPPKRESQDDSGFFASGEARARIGWWS